jgi:hypothetical protein
VKRRALAAAGVALAVLLMVSLKVHLSGAADYRRARVDLDAGRTWDAIHGLDHALHWYTPASAYVWSAAEDLWRIGQAAEARGDVAQALYAYRTLRSGFYAARSVVTPGKGWIALCDERITALAAAEADYVRRNADLTPDQRRAAVAATLAKDRAPDPFWSVVVEVGFLGWVGCAVAFIWLVVGAGAWNRRRAAAWGLAVAAFYALWIAGMLRA